MDKKKDYEILFLNPSINRLGLYCMCFELTL
jgi:hypothetical protein